MAEYRYLFYDLVTNTTITELPLTGVSFTKQLSSAGTLSANLLISDTNETALSVIAGTQPGRTALYVERSDTTNSIGRTLSWGGIIWGRTYNSTSQTIQIQAREFESYLEKVFINTLYLTRGANPDAVKFNAVDSFTMVQSLIASLVLQSRDLGIQIGNTLSGQLVSPTYVTSDYKTYYQAILDLSQSQNGFDFNVDVYYDGSGTPQKVMNLGYPRIGYQYKATDPNAPVLSLPGNVIDYEYFEDATIMANNVYVIGADGASGSAIVPLNGYPAIELNLSYSDITDTNLLSDIAIGRGSAISTPPTTLKINQSGATTPTVNKVLPGDDVRVTINDVRFPTGLNAVYRVTALTVTPNESGGPEQITYALTQPNTIYN